MYRIFSLYLPLLEITKHIKYMKVTFYLESPKGTKRNMDGLSPTAIFARISYDGYRLKYYTPETILPKFWNGTAKPHRAKETTKFPEYPEFNKRLDNIEAAVKNVIRKYANDNDNKLPTPATLKPMLDIAIRENGKVYRETFMSFFDKFIKDSEAGIRLTKKGKPITSGTIKTYYTTKVCLENYQTYSRKSVDFDNIDINFYNDFTKYLTIKIKQSTNYIGKHIKVIKTVLHEATEQKINTNLSFKSRGFTTISEEADTIYLPEHELQELANLDLNDNPRLDKTRDLFLIGCYTGLRFSDLSTLTPEQINKGMITITQIKTGDRIVIPVHDTVNKIMHKYNGELPTAVSNQKTNAALKDLAQKCDGLKKEVSISFTKGGILETKILGKWNLVTTHTARRSFATNQFLNGVPTLSIMAITGHRTEKAFMKYIKVTPDDHAKIMQSIWAERKKNVKRIAI